MYLVTDYTDQRHTHEFRQKHKAFQYTSWLRKLGHNVIISCNDVELDIEED